MRPTRRFWAIVLLWGFLAGYAVILSAPVALVGASGIGAWLVVDQRRAVRRLVEAHDRLDLTTTLSPPRVSIDEAVHLTVRATLDAPCTTPVAVVVPLPLNASAVPQSERTLRLEPGATTAETVVTFTVPVAGRFDLPAPVVDYGDPAGLANETVEWEAGETQSVVVEPRTPRSLHVGQGGERLATAYGEHPSGRSGSGLLPAEIRQYVPGDTADRIDWKATARLGKPYVREFEAEIDRQTVLLCDHRSTMGVGPTGETMLDYAREVALGLSDTARRLSDPLGLYTIGEAGITTRHDPSTTPESYRSIRTRLFDLTPTARSDHENETAGAEPVRTSRPRAASRRLAGDASAFATRLRPYLESSRPYVERLAGDPLFGAIREIQHRRSGTNWVVLLTDDTRRNRLRETVELANEEGSRVLVFLTPRVLFEEDALLDLERAYDRYVEFEEFRRELGRLPRVSAFEVTPRDRLEAVLTSRRADRARRR